MPANDFIPLYEPDFNLAEFVPGNDQEQARYIDVATRRRIPPRWQLATASHPDVAEWAKTVAAALAAREQAPKPFLLLTGDTGVGKTWQAYGAVHAVVMATATLRPTVKWKAAYWPALLGELRPREGRDSEGLYGDYAGLTLLMLDDLGVEKETEWTYTMLDRMLYDREAWGRPTVITTNLPPRSERMQSLKSRLGDRAYSRLAGSAVVTLEGEDRRLPPRAAS
jgi:DNA replication protein DnaC